MHLVGDFAGGFLETLTLLHFCLLSALLASFLSLSLRLITQAEKAGSMPPARRVKKDMGTKRVKDQTRGNGLVRGQMLIDSH